MTIKILHNKYFKLKENKDGYGSILPKFALGNKTGNTVEAISFFSHCRETLSSYLRRRVNVDTVDTKILRLLVWFAVPGTVTIRKNNTSVRINVGNKKDYFKYVSAECSKSIHRALYALNVVEKELKWRKTIIKDINHSLGNRHSLYLFAASPKWMSSPSLLSLYTLILRAGTFKNISKIRSINELAIAYTKTTKEHVIGQHADIIFLKEIAPILEEFLINVNKIYKGRNQKMNFDRSILKNSCSAFDEGITKLVKGTTGDKLVLERFLEYTRK